MFMQISEFYSKMINVKMYVSGFDLCFDVSIRWKNEEKNEAKRQSVIVISAGK